MECLCDKNFVCSVCQDSPSHADIIKALGTLKAMVTQGMFNPNEKIMQAKPLIQTLEGMLSDWEV